MCGMLLCVNCFCYHNNSFDFRIFLKCQNMLCLAWLNVSITKQNGMKREWGICKKIACTITFIAKRERWDFFRWPTFQEGMMDGERNTLENFFLFKWAFLLLCKLCSDDEQDCEHCLNEIEWEYLVVFFYVWKEYLLRTHTLTYFLV